MYKLIPVKSESNNIESNGLFDHVLCFIKQFCFFSREVDIKFKIQDFAFWICVYFFNLIVFWLEMLSNNVSAWMPGISSFTQEVPDSQI